MPSRAALAYALRALRGSLFITFPMSDQVRRDFRLDSLGAILFGVFNGAVIGYIYVVGRTIGVSPLGISLLVAMPAIGSIAALPISIAVRNQAARRFMFLSWGIGRGAVLLTLFVGTPTPYLLIMSLYLISSSIASPFYATVMQQIYPREYRGQLMSLVRIGSGLATTLSSLAVAWLLGSAHTPYQAVFAVATVFALIGLATFWRIRPVPTGAAPRPSLRATFAIVSRNRRFAVFQGALFLMAFGNIMGGTLYPLVVVDKLHAGYGPYGVLTVCSSLGYLTSFFVWGRIVDRNGPFYVMGIIGAAVAIEILNMLLAPGVWWLLPVALLSGLVNAGFELGAYAATIHYAPPREVAQYMALHSYFSGIRGLGAPFLATALLAGHHYGRGLGAGLALCVLGTVLLGLGARREIAEAGADSGPIVPRPPAHAGTLRRPD